MKYAWEVFYLVNGYVTSEIVYTKSDTEMPPLRIPSTFRRPDLDDYVPPESHVSNYEILNPSAMSNKELVDSFEDVQWMLQTRSYRAYYLSRLERLEGSLGRELDSRL